MFFGAPLISAWTMAVFGSCAIAISHAGRNLTAVCSDDESKAGDNPASFPVSYRPVLLRSPLFPNVAQAPTAEMAVTPPSIRKSAPTTYAESFDAR